jgi:hypothetical protein
MYLRIPKGLWEFQDLYIVSRSPDRDAAKFAVSLGPSGNLDGCRLTDSGYYLFEGWAADFNQGCRIHEVQILVNGELQHCCQPAYERPDVAAVYADEKGRYCGWSCCSGGGNLNPDDILMIKAISTNDLQKILWLGTLTSVLLTRAN